MVSSTDGYCSIITFSPGELGVPYVPKEESAAESSVESTAEATKTATKLVSSNTMECEDVNGEISKQSDLVASIDLTKDEDDFEGIMKLDDENSFDKKPDAEKEINIQKDSSEPGVKPAEKDVSPPSTETTLNGETSGNQCGSPDSKSDANPVKNCATPSSNVPRIEEVITPGNSGKKARRVQLITLSSPKSKKKLL